MSIARKPSQMLVITISLRELEPNVLRGLNSTTGRLVNELDECLERTAEKPALDEADCERAAREWAREQKREPAERRKQSSSVDITPNSTNSRTI